MSSRAQIRIDFQQAINQAKRLDDIADKLDRTAKKSMENSIQNLASAWKGDNASAFLKKEERLKEKISTTSEHVRAIADDIRRVARAIYDAEMESWRIANERKS